MAAIFICNKCITYIVTAEAQATTDSDLYGVLLSK